MRRSIVIIYRSRVSSTIIIIGDETLYTKSVLIIYRYYVMRSKTYATESKKYIFLQNENDVLLTSDDHSCRCI